MKMVRKAFAASFLIHLFYIAITLLTGYILTKNYEPDLSNEWDSVVVLQSEVAFGVVQGSPFYVVFSLMAGAVLCWIILYTWSKVSKVKG
ncbi:hypothetical protein WQ57_17290 [Mesobacillus campisalis]|uniref:Uncharacterized protein n=1 Tax=Mesobacillus campisalis TaxID=1408103 RepID=A0A0M2SW14_9BACI|nr:hypothetical protein [Mesobacillus campisalis]KKK36815.1 hypothetical protein WQ57_17290 [Mesobacillus campisalis]